MLGPKFPLALRGELVPASAKSGPPVAVAALTMAGVGLQDWVYILTAIYLVTQTGYLVWKWFREWRKPFGA